jgi:hypothetical protein
VRGQSVRFGHSPSSSRSLRPGTFGAVIFLFGWMAKLGASARGAISILVGIMNDNEGKNSIRHKIIFDPIKFGVAWHVKLYIRAI